MDQKIIIVLVNMRDRTGARIGIVFLFCAVSPSTSGKSWTWIVDRIMRLLYARALRAMISRPSEDPSRRLSCGDRQKQLEGIPIIDIAPTSKQRYPESVHIFFATQCPENVKSS